MAAPARVMSEVGRKISANCLKLAALAVLRNAALPACHHPLFLSFHSSMKGAFYINKTTKGTLQKFAFHHSDVKREGEKRVRVGDTLTKFFHISHSHRSDLILNIL